MERLLHFTHEKEPKAHRAIIYAGQGNEPDESLFRDPVGKRYIQTVEEVLGFSIDSSLYQTHPQVAIFLGNFLEAKRQKLQSKDFDNPEFVAGHSLGELNAVLDSGAINFEDSIKLVSARQKGYDLVQGGGLIYPKGLSDTDNRLGELLNSVKDIHISSINTDDQVILAGTDQALEEGSKWLTDRGIKKISRLPVKGPFHSPLMKAAVDPVAEALSKIRLKQANIPIVANSTASPIETPDEIKNELINQITSPVLWKKTMEFMDRNGITETIEFGNKKGILSSMNAKILGGVAIAAVVGTGVYFWKKHHSTEQS